MALMAVLHFAVQAIGSKARRRKDEMTSRIQLIGTEPFDHAGHSFVAQFKRIDGYNVGLIKDFSEQRNHGQAQISAVHNSLHKLTRDGKEIELGIRKDGGTNIPADYDPDKPRGERFVMDVLLRFLVNKYQTFLAEEWEDSFGSYADAVLEAEDENPTSTGSVSTISRSSQTTEEVG